MPEANPYFEILHLGDRVELRPSTSLIGIKTQSAGCIFLILIPPLVLYWCYGERHLTELWIISGSVIPIWLIIVFVNRRLRRQATVPLTITPGPYILHGETLLSARIVYDSVQLAAKENYDNPDTYNVLLVPAEGEPVTLPQPYFGDLDFNPAVLLANDVAKLLQIPFERTLMPKDEMD